jgi:hypothetical protein
MKPFFVLVLLVFMLSSIFPVFAQDPTATPAPQNNEAALGIRRVIGSNELVVALLPSGVLEYYEIVDSKGLLIGITPAGWRNDSLGERVVQRVSRADGTTAELAYIGNTRYSVTLFNRYGSQVTRQIFSADGIASGTGIVASTNIVPASSTQFVVTTIPSYTAVVDSGTFNRAQGTFDGTYYVVAAGDNLYRIALRFKTTLRNLQTLNNISNANLIYAGQRLRIY